MTTLLEDLRARLVAAVAPSGGVWVQRNTLQPHTYPYLVVSRVVSTANVALGGPSALQNTRVQIDIVSRSMSEAVALETAVESAMDGWSVQNVPVSSVDLYEDEVRAFRVSKDFSIWATN